VLRFERLLPRLGDLHVVVPALPGFPFAPPSATAASAQTMADMVSDGMAALGHERYVVSGGDVGGTVAEHLAAAHPDRVSALHLSNVSLGHVATVDATRLPPAAAEFVGRLAEWRRTHGGFVAEQSTRPSTLIAALGDSPAGLLAWIGEKLLDWSDRSDGPAFSPDELLTWVTAYWSTGTIGTSFSSYVESAPLPDHLDVPTVMSSFALDIVPAPRSFAELFVRVEEFVHHDAGGHFAAWERPDLYEADLRRAVALGRS
jgi:pimeloyl-ACP methyl ester carboxylesterase